MAARGYEFYLRVLKVPLTSERSDSYIKHKFFYSFSKQQNKAIKVLTYRKMPVTTML